MDARERNFYARQVLELRGMSECSSPRSAIVVRSKWGIISTAYSSYILPVSKKYERSPVATAVLAFFQDIGQPVVHPREAPVLFSSYFPSYEDFMLLMYTRIRTVYYMGDIENPKTVQFLNDHTAGDRSDGFEIVKLEFSGGLL